MSRGSTHLLAAHETNVERHALGSPPFDRLSRHCAVNESSPFGGKHLKLHRVEFIKDFRRLVGHHKYQ